MRDQTIKPSNHQTIKPYKALIALLAALALCFCAACSSEDDSDPDPAYCGTWAPTESLITYLNAALQQATSSSKANEEEATASEEEASDGQAASSIQLSTSTLSLTISSNNTVSISVAGIITIPGSYTYEGDDDSSGTFKFTLTLADSIATIATPIAAVFTENDITYATGSLSAVLDESSSEATQIFTK